MVSEKKKLLSSKQVCSIIRACASSGVTSLKLGDLEIEFGKQTKTEPTEAISSGLSENVTSKSNPVTEMTDEQHKTQNEESLQEDVLRLREEQLSHMLVEDPLHAEQLVAEGDLEDDDDTTDPGSNE